MDPLNPRAQLMTLINRLDDNQVTRLLQKGPADMIGRPDRDGKPGGLGALGDMLKGGGRRALELVGAGRRLGGARLLQHAQQRAQGRQWRPLGYGRVTNGTGSAGYIYLSSNTATPGNAVNVVTPIHAARLVIQNDGGSCDSVLVFKKDGQVLYTGPGAFPSAEALIGKTTGVIDALDKDTGLPVGDIGLTFDIAVYLADGDSAVIGFNGYVDISVANVVDNDDDAE